MSDSKKSVVHRFCFTPNVSLICICDICLCGSFISIIWITLLIGDSIVTVEWFFVYLDNDVFIGNDVGYELRKLVAVEYTDGVCLLLLIW